MPVTFLEGFALRDSPAFDDWQLGQAGALDRELASALRRLVEHLVAAGDLERAVPLARRWLDLDPLHEPAHRELMRPHSRGVGIEARPSSSTGPACAS